MNRRDFGRMAVGVGAAAALPGFGQGAAGRKIGYCAVGLGRISVDHFMPGTRTSEHGQMTGLVSGHREKALKIAKEYGIPESSVYSYEEYDRMRDNPAIDAVYIGLPNSMHAEYTIRAAQAGKHVLCEKPMATTVADCEAMVAACKKADKRLMIAYRLHVEPTTLKAREIVQSGRLGKIEAIESANGFNIAPGEWRCDGKLAGGGPLMDVGIYSLNAARFLTGEEPVSLSAYSSVIDQDGRFKEVEENLGWTMKMASGAVASCTTTYGANMDGFIRLHGSKGTLTVNGFGYEGIHVTGRINGASKGMPAENVDVMEQEKDPFQFKLESDSFSKCVMEGTKPGPSGEEGLRDVVLMMKMYESARKGGAMMSV